MPPQIKIKYMSKKLVENIHYMYAQTSKSFVAYDIIDTGKYISVLQQDKKGNLTTFMILQKINQSLGEY